MILLKNSMKKGNIWLPYQTTGKKNPLFMAYTLIVVVPFFLLTNIP
jgi:hypothetical protein